jgi:hypothetical protein
VLRVDALTRRRWRAGHPIALERIKLHEPEAFAGMCKAGRLVAECLPEHAGTGDQAGGHDRALRWPRSFEQSRRECPNVWSE